MRDSEVFKGGGVVLEGFELVLQSRYLDQSDISTRCGVCVCVCVCVCVYVHMRACSVTAASLGVVSGT